MGAGKVLLSGGRRVCVSAVVQEGKTNDFEKGRGDYASYNGSGAHGFRPDPGLASPDL